LGDFNCEPTDRVFRLTERGSWKVSSDVNAVRNGTAKWPSFYNPMVKAPNIFGTFKSDNHGLSSPMVDHILVSGKLCEPPGLQYQTGSIVASPFQPRASDHAAIGAVLQY
jgi:endonuclease/exonuclease/phosphatase family metal-dependent hydrolase